MFIEKYDATKWQIIERREPKVGEYILCYDRDFQKMISQVEEGDIKIKKCFVMERMGE